MTLRSEFALLYYRKEIVMLVNGTLDLITNLLINHVDLLSDTQKLPVASHLNALNSSFRFCCQDSAFTCMHKSG